MKRLIEFLQSGLDGETLIATMAIYALNGICGIILAIPISYLIGWTLTWWLLPLIFLFFIFIQQRFLRRETKKQIELDIDPPTVIRSYAAPMMPLPALSAPAMPAPIIPTPAPRRKRISGWWVLVGIFVCVCSGFIHSYQGIVTENNKIKAENQQLKQHIGELQSNIHSLGKLKQKTANELAVANKSIDALTRKAKTLDSRNQEINRLLAVAMAQKREAEKRISSLNEGLRAYQAKLAKANGLNRNLIAANVSNSSNLTFGKQLNNYLINENLKLKQSVDDLQHRSTITELPATDVEITSGGNDTDRGYIVVSSVDESGEPVADALISGIGDTDKGVTVKPFVRNTDDRGKLHISAPPGKYQLVVTKSGRNIRAEAEITVKAGTDRVSPPEKVIILKPSVSEPSSTPPSAPATPEPEPTPAA